MSSVNKLSPIRSQNLLDDIRRLDDSDDAEPLIRREGKSPNNSSFIDLNQIRELH